MWYTLVYVSVGQLLLFAIIVWAIHHPSQNPRASTTEEEERGEEGTLTLIRFRSVREKPYIRRIQVPAPVALRERIWTFELQRRQSLGFLSLRR